MTSTARAFEENKQGFFNTPQPDLAHAGQQQMMTVANDAPNPSVQVNALSGVASMMPASTAQNVTANNDDIVGSANLAGGNITDPNLKGVQCNSGSDITYGINQGMQLASQALFGLFDAARDKSADMQAPAPQAKIGMSSGPGFMGL